MLVFKGLNMFKTRKIIKLELQTFEALNFDEFVVISYHKSY